MCMGVWSCVQLFFPLLSTYFKITSTSPSLFMYMYRDSKDSGEEKQDNLEKIERKGRKSKEDL